MIEAAKKSTVELQTRAALLREAHEKLHSFRLEAKTMGEQLRDVQADSAVIFEGIYEALEDFGLAIEEEQAGLSAKLNQEIVSPPEMVTA